MAKVAVKNRIINSSGILTLIAVFSLNIDNIANLFHIEDLLPDFFRFQASSKALFVNMLAILSFSVVKFWETRVMRAKLFWILLAAFVTVSLISLNAVTVHYDIVPELKIWSCRWTALALQILFYALLYMIDRQENVELTIKYNRIVIVNY